MKFVRSYKSERTLFVKKGEWFVNTRMCELVTHPYSKSARPNRVFQSKNKRFGGDRYYVYSEPVWVAADGLVITARWVSYAHFQNIKQQQALWLIGFVARTVSGKYTNGAVVQYTSLLRKTIAPQLLAIAARRRHTVCVELSARVKGRLSVNGRSRKLTKQAHKAWKVIQRSRS